MTFLMMMRLADRELLDVAIPWLIATAGRVALLASICATVSILGLSIRRHGEGGFGR